MTETQDHANAAPHKPRFGIGEWIGVIGLLLAVGSWWHSAKSRDLSVASSPVVAEIVKADVVSDIAVTYKGVGITKSLRAYQLALWNHGREPIKHEDILKPIQIKWQPDTQVLDVKLVQRTRDETSAEISKLSLVDRIVEVDFKILEKSDGVLLQFLVAGDTKLLPSIEGSIVDQGKLGAASFKTTKFKFGNKPLDKLVPATILFFCLAMPFMMYAAFGSTIKQYWIDKRFKVGSWPAFFAVLGAPIFITVMSLILGVSYAVDLFLQNSPFGF